MKHKPPGIHEHIDEKKFNVTFVRNHVFQVGIITFEKSPIAQVYVFPSPDKKTQYEQ